MTMYQSLERFSLRKINFVKTRTTILKAVLSLLKEKDFSSITIDEICQKAQISRGTFFNYFPTKEHVFHYYLRIFTIKIALRIKNWKKERSFKDKLNEIYKWFNEETQYSRFINNYFNFLINVGEEHNEMKLTDAEFVYFYNGIDDEEYSYYNALTFSKIFDEICQEAKRKGDISLELSSSELASILTGSLVGSYLVGYLNPNINYLDILQKIWKF